VTLADGLGATELPDAGLTGVVIAGGAVQEGATGIELETGATGVLTAEELETGVTGVLAAEELETGATGVLAAEELETGPTGVLMAELETGTLLDEAVPELVGTAGIVEV